MDISGKTIFDLGRLTNDELREVLKTQRAALILMLEQNAHKGPAPRITGFVMDEDFAEDLVHVLLMNCYRKGMEDRLEEAFARFPETYRSLAIKFQIMNNKVLGPPNNNPTVDDIPMFRQSLEFGCDAANGIQKLPRETAQEALVDVICGRNSAEAKGAAFIILNRILPIVQPNLIEKILNAMDATKQVDRRHELGALIDRPKPFASESEMLNALDSAPMMNQPKWLDLSDIALRTKSRSALTGKQQNTVAALLRAKDRREAAYTIEWLEPDPVQRLGHSIYQQAKAANRRNDLWVFLQLLVTVSDEWLLELAENLASEREAWGGKGAANNKPTSILLSVFYERDLHGPLVFIRSMPALSLHVDLESCLSFQGSIRQTNPALLAENLEGDPERFERRFWEKLVPTTRIDFGGRYVDVEIDPQGTLNVVIDGKSSKSFPRRRKEDTISDDAFGHVKAEFTALKRRVETAASNLAARHQMGFAWSGRFFRELLDFPTFQKLASGLVFDVDGDLIILDGVQAFDADDQRVEIGGEAVVRIARFTKESSSQKWRHKLAESERFQPFDQFA